MYMIEIDYYCLEYIKKRVITIPWDGGSLSPTVEKWLDSLQLFTYPLEKSRSVIFFSGDDLGHG